MLDAIDASSIKYAIQQAQNPDQVRLVGAKHIQTQVHNALRFELGSYPAAYASDDTVTNTLRADQYTNCHGYATVTSEALSLAGIQNYFVYFKGHFMNGILTDEQTDDPQLHMFDVANPYLSQNITNTIRGTTVSRLLDEEQRLGRGAARIDTERLLNNAGFDADAFTTSSNTTYDWLYFQKGKTTRLGHDNGRFDRDELWARRNRYTSIMSVYGAEIGRRVLPACATFIMATTKETFDADRALQSSNLLTGLFPELDARLSHDGIKLLVRSLARQNRSIDALTATLNYCSSFAASTDPRLKGLEAGRYYDIAIATNDAAIAGLGLFAYRQALGENSKAHRKPYQSDTYKSKMQRLQQIIEQEPTKGTK